MRYRINWCNAQCSNCHLLDSVAFIKIGAAKLYLFSIQQLKHIPNYHVDSDMCVSVIQQYI